MNTDFLIERKLESEAPELSKRVSDSVFVLQNMLDSFLPRFPDFTDHSILHSLDVLDYCNRLIGEKQIKELSLAECYVLIMACYLHDLGMGINQKDYEEFSKKIDFGNYFEEHSASDSAWIIRNFHNEYSGHMIRKYADLFEIPLQELLYAVIQVSRGHRKTDLMDVNEYRDLRTEYGIVRTAYLAAIIRLADEIDVGAERNPELLFDRSKITTTRGLAYFGTNESIRNVEVAEDSIILHVKPKAPEFVPLIEKLNDKIQKTLDYCREVVAARSQFKISQEKSIIMMM